MYEDDFYQVEKVIASYNNINLPEELSIDFNEPEYPKTVQDQILLDEHKLKHFMLDRAGLLMEHNKDLSRVEAESIIENNKNNSDFEIEDNNEVQSTKNS